MLCKSLIRGAALAAACFFSLHASAHAEDYPAKPITLIVGYPAGGSVDLIARVTAPELSKRLGQPVIIENLGGGGGTIGAARAVKAAPDGYTLLVGSGSEISIAKLTNPSVRYDGQRDLAPISLVGTIPMVLVGSPTLAANNTDELVALVKTQPGKFNFASSGIGTPLHLAGEYINSQGKIDMTHVPYKGAGQMATDLMGGQIELSVFVLSSAMSHIKSGKVKAFGVTEANRSAAAPDIPALNESKSLDGIDMGVWFGLFAPAKTPDGIQSRLHKELMEVLKEPAVRAKLAESGVRIIGNTPSEFAAFIKAETDKYRSIVTQAGIKTE
jgi:tripartite-type tricarboxylate transporter receptor subunit TctC